jgi:hypothetical protein
MNTKNLPSQNIESETNKLNSELNLTTDKKQNSRRKLFIVIFICLAVVGFSVAGYLYVSNSHKIKNTNQKVIGVKKLIAKPTSTDFTAVILANGDTKINDRTWFKNPVEKPITDFTVLDKSNLYVDTCLDNECVKKQADPAYKFYAIGKLSDGSDIILASYQFQGQTNMIFLSKDGKNTILKNYSKDFFNQSTNEFNSQVGINTTINQTTSYPELNLPNTISINGSIFLLNSTTSPGISDIGSPVNDPNKNVTNYSKTKYGDVSKETRVGSGNTYRADRYFITGFDKRPYYYQPAPALGKYQVSQIKFSDNTTNKAEYDNGFHGCSFGGSFYDIILDSNTSFTKIATTNDGQSLYEMNNASTSEIYLQTLKAFNTQNFNNPSSKNVSMQEFIDQHSIVFFKNSLNQYSALYNTSYIAGGGCGKPVIYLYPTKTTKISVKIDANILTSIPKYNNGWNVTAQPNGTLTNSDNAIYRNLFWEGIGKSYPDISSGIIVNQADLKDTVVNNLKELGLNSQERTDFLEYWLPKLPKTPYVRLTWFGTNQVNQIAPLKVSPNPDTLIRIFLDSEGLNQPIQIPTEKLASIPRKGFTVVEWGGLIR